MQVRTGYLHFEPDGIKAIDQKGGGKKIKLQQTRLYIYPDIKTKKIFLLAIGTKTNQNEDINKCRKIVKKIKEGESYG